ALSFSSTAAHRYLHSFPTRRSSDLAGLLLVERGEASVHRDELRADLAQRIVRQGLAQALRQRPQDRPVLAGVARRIDGAQSELRSEEHTSELQSRFDLVCRLLLEKK